MIDLTNALEAEWEQIPAYVHKYAKHKKKQAQERNCKVILVESLWTSKKGTGVLVSAPQCPASAFLPEKKSYMDTQA